MRVQSAVQSNESNRSSMKQTEIAKMAEEEGGWRSSKGLLIAGGAAVLAALAGAAWFATRGKTGKGRKSYPTGEVYEGDLVNGCANGFGTSRTAAGDVVTGYWKDDYPCGKCSGVFAGGHRFEGEAFDATHWKGTFVYPGKVEMDFDGAFDIGSSGLTGRVVIRDESGEESFRGTFVNSVPDGDDCREVGIDGTYTGSIRKGERNGRGKLVGPNGNTYEGDWDAGRKHGSGEMQYANGERFAGSWKEGQWADGLLHRPDGRVDTVMGGKIVK
jgi:hypothetical protein